jgi:hypothetical protein
MYTLYLINFAIKANKNSCAIFQTTIVASIHLSPRNPLNDPDMDRLNNIGHVFVCDPYFLNILMAIAHYKVI